MTKERKLYYSTVNNRFGYTNFVKDHQKMSDDYEKYLNAEDKNGSWIDGMDSYFIATVNELGVKKELEIKKLKKQNKKLKKKLKRINKQS